MEVEPSLQDTTRGQVGAPCTSPTTSNISTILLQVERIVDR